MTELSAALLLALWAIAMSLLGLAALTLLAQRGQRGLDTCERCGTPTDNGRICRNCAPIQE
ncbi:hypothetical protein [Deinococcus sp. ME38]|uniref:hypothetical protein n=1 Tax=Deinococcus sp. ME38 TaxID=3400344 RepID=UPI003B5CA638